MNNENCTQIKRATPTQQKKNNIQTKKGAKCP
jgi:hypothetical protein